MNASYETSPGIPSAGNVPFLFGVTQARDLPGPILTSLLTDLGMTRSAARTLLSRLRKHGSLTVTHTGRVGVYRLAGHMAAGFRRLARGPVNPDWDGLFRTVVFDLPESQRGLKDKLRYTATINGFGQLRSGVLISPFDKHEAFEPLHRTEFTDGMIAHGTLRFDPQTSIRIAARAWDLPGRSRALRAAARRVAEDLDRVGGITDGPEALRRMHRHAMESLSIRLTDPGLPAELLPDDWAATDLDQALVRITTSLGPAVGRYVTELIESSPHRGLVVERPDAMADRVRVPTGS